MGRVATVTLYRAETASTIKINASNYASNIEGWLSKGFKLVGEDSRGEPAAVVDTGSGGPVAVDLETLTKAELIAFAEDTLGLTLEDSMKKDDMVEAIREVLAEAEQA